MQKYIFYWIYLSFQSRFKMKEGITILVFYLFITGITALHLQSSVQEQIDTLMSQQNQFKQRINKIVGNIGQIDQKVNQTQNINDKVIILENAILSEREEIYKLSTVIIPPFNISKASCEKMTDQQKVNLLEDLYKAREQVNKLKNLTEQLPECDKKKFLLSDIQKQIFFMDSIESIIFTNCQVNIILSPSIFQTNIYAKNWILGNLTIDDLIEQYYQRSMKYQNITNCPIDYPYFNGYRCVMCADDTPVFNISSRQCVSCGEHNRVDNDKKKCVKQLFNTNWTSLTNYDSGNQPLPVAKEGSTPCPPSKPYYNGSQCIICELPKYFSVLQLKCKECEKGKVFDMNSKTCETKKNNDLTRLSGTKWVSNQTVYEVLSDRAKALEKNKTLGNYRYCPTDTPYYDGNTCISCPNEFSLNQTKCVSAPQGEAYDPNLHTYVPPESNKETNPDAKNIVGHTQTDHPNIENCNQTNPYYDGVACINCSAPFPLFNSQSKRCVVCDAQKVYNSTSHKCEQRPVVYISNNNDRLMATPIVSIDQYEDKVTKAMNKPDAIILNCPNASQYSNFNHCFTCNSSQYFNVEYKICDTCTDGKMNQTTKICIPKLHFISNLASPNIINFPTNRSDEQAAIAKIRKQYPNIVECPIETPFFNGTQCMKCETPFQFFDYQTTQCVGCPKGTAYNNGTCSKVEQFSNIAALKNILVVQTPPNNTLSKLEQKFDSYKSQNLPYKVCPVDKPFYNQTTQNCSNCSQGSAIDLYTKQCVPCENYDNTTKQCYILPTFTNVQALSNTRVTQTSNHTLQNISNQIQSYVNATGHPYKMCIASSPYFNTTSQQCSNCSNGTSLNLETQTCIQCQYYDNITKRCYILPTFSNIQALNQTNVIQTFPNYTIQTIANNIQNYTNTTGHPYKQCLASVPYFNSSSMQCSTCTNGTFLNLETKSCDQCQYYDNITKRCYILPSFSNVTALNETNYIQSSPNYTLTNITNNILNYTNTTGRPYKMCPGTHPYYNVSDHQCTKCANGTYLSLEARSCVECQNYSPEQKLCLPPVPHYANLSNYNWTVNNSTITDIYNWTNTLKAVPGAQECPVGIEFYNNNTQKCQSCPNNTYFNYDTYQCIDCSPQVFDINVHQCLNQSQNNTYQTSPNSSNLTYGGIPSNQYLDWYNANKTAYPNISDCPVDKPYYDGINCIMCPPIAPYFSIKTRLCHTCPQNSTYSATRQECVSTQGGTVTNYPNPAKMYASIFHQAAITRPES